MLRFLFLGLAWSIAQSAGTAAEKLSTVASQSCWTLASDQVELAITELGGHMAPVTFDRHSSQPIQPYYVSPWQGEELRIDVPVLVPLRGDFFCMPFGSNAEAFRGEQHPPHGEVAGSKWSFVSRSSEAGRHTLTLSLPTTARKGIVTKELTLLDGQNVVYSRHRIEDFSGPAPLGHHATLRLPGEAESLKVQSSPFEFGLTNPTQFSNPAMGEYQSLAIGHRFTSLEEIPTIWKDAPPANATLHPARTGFADLLAVFKRPRNSDPAWMTAINRTEGYLWFSLKDPEILPATLFWIENQGRHGSPWNGRNRCLGLEDVCGYFADGLVPSAGDNLLHQAGVATAITLQADEPTEIRYIQGAVPVPKGFNEIASVAFESGKMTVTSNEGVRVEIPVHHEFLQTGRLQ